MQPTSASEAECWRRTRRKGTGSPGGRRMTTPRGNLGLLWLRAIQRRQNGSVKNAKFGQGVP